MSEQAESDLINEILCSLDEAKETLSETQEQIVWKAIYRFKISYKTEEDLK